MSGDPTIYNVVSLPASFGMCFVHACRLCGALVAIDPPDYADQHLKWHERHDMRVSGHGQPS